MKRIMIFTPILLAAFILNAAHSIPRAAALAEADVSASQFSSGGSSGSCPDLPVQVVQLDVGPASLAPKYGIKAAWTANAPQCFTIRRFIVKANVTFANGQTKSIQKTLPPSQTSFQGDVPGAGALPRLADVTVTAIATASASGNAAYPSGISISTNCPKIPVHITHTAFNGLQSIPNRPGDYHPKVKVVWDVNGLLSCVTVKEFKLTVRVEA
ncbi:MAG: hypothetical protein L0229_07660, partial [Blastocatellia bacterium]|nr:hypothetical protein [Blastocatellia bacterium]